MTLFDQLFPPRLEDPRPYSPYAPIRTRRRPRHGGPADDRPKAPHEREAEIARVAAQMARVAATVPWGRVQDDAWDRLSAFVYRLRAFASVRARAESVAARVLPPSERRAFVDYALRRWYCFWGAQLAELLFLGYPGVEPGPPRHHEVDFTIDGVPFDLKTSELPRMFQSAAEDLSKNPGKIASWLYQHQSREGRFHSANRLFLLLCDVAHPEEAWRLRGDVPALRAAIDAFMARRRFLELRVPDRFGEERAVLTAVVSVVPLVEAPRQLAMGF